MKSLRRASYGIIDKIRLKQGLVARSRGNTVSSQSKSSNQSTNGTHLTQRDSREELQSINAQLSTDNALLRRQLSEKERKLTEKDRTIGTDGSSWKKASKSHKSDRPQNTQLFSVVQFDFLEHVSNELIGQGQFTAPRFNSFL